MICYAFLRDLISWVYV